MTQREMNCPSCGVDYGDHLGLIGTCGSLQQARKELAEAVYFLSKFVNYVHDDPANYERARQLIRRVKEVERGA